MKTPSPKPDILDAPNDRPVRVSVVEDDDVVREQLVYQLKRVTGFVLVGSHRSAEHAWRKFRGKNRTWCSWTSTCPR
jgi:hypothetical protein